MFYDPEIKTFDEVDAEITHQYTRLKEARVGDSETLQEIYTKRMNLALEHRFKLKQDIGRAAVELFQREPITPDFMD